MTAYREIIRTPQDILYVTNLLKKLDSMVEVIIVPLEEKEADLKELQISAMAKTWDNSEDEAWNEL
ncbi:MAG: hypothetical protein WC272_02855 [Sulfurimonas sp.]|jgi:hypothetical protein